MPGSTFSRTLSEDFTDGVQGLYRRRARSEYRKINALTKLSRGLCRRTLISKSKYLSLIASIGRVPDDKPYPGR